MNRKLLLWIVALPLLGGLSFLGSYLGSSNAGGLWGKSIPVIDCPEMIDLGEQEWGHLAVARFTVANRGDAELLIDQIQTSCSCSGLEREEGKEFTPVASLRLDPGEEVKLALRISIRGEPGSPSRNLVQFRTNDPARPLVRVETVIPLITGVTTVPREVTFATITTGDDARKVVEVHDLSGKRRAVERVSSNNPDRFSARLLPPEADEGARENERLDKLIGRVEVQLKTGVPGSVGGTIEIQLAGQEHSVVVPVIGSVAADVEVSPASVVLPRQSGDGPLYYADCLCRSTKGDPLTIKLDSSPEGIIVEVSAVEGNPAAQKVRITLDPSSVNTATPTTVRLSASAGGRESSLEVRVSRRGER